VKPDGLLLDYFAGEGDVMTQDEFNALMRGFYKERGKKCVHSDMEIRFYRLCTLGFFAFFVPALISGVIEVFRFMTSFS
jgi:hypothetical protein